MSTERYKQKISEYFQRLSWYTNVTLLLIIKNLPH